MTGATSGIGREAAAELLRRDAQLHLVMLARGATGRVTLTELQSIRSDVTLVETDLASAASVRAAAETVRRRLDSGDLPPLGGIVGNAGVSFNDAQRSTPDGYETTFAVNVLANHMLLGELAPGLTSPARIVITVSDTHFGDLKHGGGLFKLRWSDPDVLARPGAFPRPGASSAGRSAYATSKLAAIYLVHEWARRLPDGVDIGQAPDGVDIVAYNPALVPGTGLSRDGGLTRIFMRYVTRPLAATPLLDSVPAAGRRLADVILGGATAPTGSYIDRTRAVRSSEESYDPDRERALWEYAERLRTSAAI
ncbi:SDR family NAD(P)-dependent oxidoreductase [Streptomyces sp. NPDC088124]|uniref:SDR family NAD(P)-dependent oxidoreductase n=1 Tax=Streptomyces sp. NPDC088124 TaxID=3154654 RepID=UPI003437033A